MQNCDARLTGFGAQIGALSKKKKKKMGSVSATLLFSTFIARHGKTLEQVVVLEPAALQLQKFSLWVSVFSVTRYADAAEKKKSN